MNDKFEGAIVIKESVNHNFEIGDKIEVIDFRELGRNIYTYVFIRESDRMICELDEDDFAFIVDNQSKLKGGKQ